MRDLSEHLGRWTRGRTCLVGVGDVGHGDDAFGVRVVQAVAARWGRTGGSPRLPLLLEAGREPERYLVALVDGRFDHVVFLDAVDFGAPAGTLLLADAVEVRSRLPQVSTHRIGLGVLASEIEARGGARAWLLGVQPESLAPGPMSPTVRAAVDVLAGELAARWRPGRAAPSRIDGRRIGR